MDDIVNAIGNNSPRPPVLQFANTSRNPASFKPQKKSIVLEKKVLDLCYQFEEDSLNALAYIIAHELAHSYCRHGWQTQFASLDFSKENDAKIQTLDKRIDDETQADIYAGFFAHIAGYNALDVAGEFLKKIYQEYGLPDTIPGYPSLQERILVIEDSKAEFNKLKRVYDFAIIAFSLGQYDYASRLYTLILDKEFTSREIYNNLGLCYVYEALQLNTEQQFGNLIFPFQLDLESRLVETEDQRSVANKAEVIYLMNLAIDEFSLALELSPEYVQAKENLYFAQLILKKYGEDVRMAYDESDILELGNCCPYCVSGITCAIDGSENKSLKNFKLGTKNGCAICELNVTQELSQESVQESITSSNLEYDGFDIYCKDFSSRDCDSYISQSNSISFCFNAKQSFNSAMIKVNNRGDRKCISLIEVKEGFIEGIEDIAIGDQVSKLTSLFPSSELYMAGKQTFYNIKSKRISYRVENDIIQSGYYYERID